MRYTNFAIAIVASTSTSYGYGHGLRSDHEHEKGTVTGDSDQYVGAWETNNTRKAVVGNGNGK